MKKWLIYRIKFSVILLLAVTFTVPAQTVLNESMDETEIEATKQTEKLQKELNLSDEQVKKVYDINLHYARERKQVTNRSDIVKMMKNKENDIHKVLNNQQRNQLNEIRSQGQSVEIDGKRNYLRTNEVQRNTRTQQEDSRKNSSTTRSGTEPVRNEPQNNNRPVRQNFEPQNNQRSSSSIQNRNRSEANSRSNAVREQTKNQSNNRPVRK